jgi:hypothetical protein
MLYTLVSSPYSQFLNYITQRYATSQKNMATAFCIFKQNYMLSLLNIYLYIYKQWKQIISLYTRNCITSVLKLTQKYQNLPKWLFQVVSAASSPPSPGVPVSALLAPALPLPASAVLDPGGVAVRGDKAARGRAPAPEVLASAWSGKKSQKFHHK